MTGFNSKRDAAADKLQEPVAYLCENAVGHKYFRWKKPSSSYKPIALYIAPPKHEWVGLTDEDTFEIGERLGLADVAWIDLMKAIEAKLKERNS